MLTLAKESLEIKRCPDIKYYLRQLENLGQWVLLLSIFLLLVLTLVTADQVSEDAIVLYVEKIIITVIEL